MGCTQLPYRSDKSLSFQSPYDPLGQTKMAQWAVTKLSSNLQMGRNQNNPQFSPWPKGQNQNIPNSPMGRNQNYPGNYLLGLSPSLSSLSLRHKSTIKKRTLRGEKSRPAQKTHVLPLIPSTVSPLHRRHHRR